MYNFQKELLIAINPFVRSAYAAEIKRFHARTRALLSADVAIVGVLQPLP